MREGGKEQKGSDFVLLFNGAEAAVRGSVVLNETEQRTLSAASMLHWIACNPSNQSEPDKHVWEPTGTLLILFFFCYT